MVLQSTGNTSYHASYKAMKSILGNQFAWAVSDQYLHRTCAHLIMS